MASIMSAYCTIRDQKVWLNGALFYEANEPLDLSAFLGELYKQSEMTYPKFFKMDKLCKLGVLAAELVIRNTPDFAQLPLDDMGLVFSNAASSLDSDRTHAKAIADKQNYFPSPSVFVYTLPNIVIGEIAIRHKITGENAFFVSEKFDAETLYTYCHQLLESNTCSSVICGWVNVDAALAEAFVVCVKKLNFKQENVPSTQAFHSKNIQHLYSSHYGSTGNN